MSGLHLTVTWHILIVLIVSRRGEEEGAPSIPHMDPPELTFRVLTLTHRKPVALQQPSQQSKLECHSNNHASQVQEYNPQSVNSWDGGPFYKRLCRNGKLCWQRPGNVKPMNWNIWNRWPHLLPSSGWWCWTFRPSNLSWFPMPQQWGYPLSKVLPFHLAFLQL